MIKIANIEIYHDIQLSFGTSDVKRTVIKQNSEDTHVLRIKLYDKQNNEMTIGSNWDITISAVKGDKTHILNTNNISVANNTIQVTMTKQMLAAPGTEKCELIIQDGNQTLFSDTFLIYVEPNVQDGSSIESIDEYDSIVDSINKVKGYEKEALTAKDHIVTISNEVDVLKKDIETTYDELEEAVTRTNDLIAENEVIKKNEADRVNAETTRVTEFNKIKNDAQTEITKLQNVNVEAIEGQDSYQVKVTDKDGNSKTSDNLLNKISIGIVDKGDYNENPSATITGEFGNQKLNLRLPTGNPFIITNTYSSISEMEADKDNIDLYDFVMINTGSVEDEDTGKLYMKDKNGMMFITDLSGVQGIQGVKGETGETPQLTIGSVTTGNPGTNASVTITGTKENPVINFVIPRGATGKIENVSADSIGYSSPTDTKTIKDVIDEKLGKSENAVSATKATNDKNGNDIATTYVKSLTVEGRVITYTKGDGTTNTITTQDTVYTHPTSDGNKHVPANGTTNGGKYLKATSTAGSYEWDSLTISNVDGLQSALDGKAASSHSHTKSQITDFPTSLPANGGNADTVNNHTVESDVPVNAKFTDTVYDDSSLSSKVTQNTNDISALKTADNVLSSRIDAFTSLTQGSTTGDAELIDIRVKADGTTATSAGNAVREQISELKADLQVEVDLLKSLGLSVDEDGYVIQTI